MTVAKPRAMLSADANSLAETVKKTKEGERKC
jgi:hypothetical protein